MKVRNLTLVHGTSVAGPFALSPASARNVGHRAYGLVKGVIADTEIYARGQELRLDARELEIELGVGSDQIREALFMLEREGYLRAAHGPDVYIIRKSKLEIIEIIQMWAALEHLDRYSRVDIAFHESLIALSGSRTLADEIGKPYIHVRAIRRAIITQYGRAASSIADHLKIIEALERRETEVAERLSLKHTLALASQVEGLWAFAN